MRDTVFFSAADGGRRHDIEGSPLDWVMTVTRESTGSLIETPQNPWTPTGDSSAIRFRTGEITFEKEDGSDNRNIYRCRTFAANWLACVLKGSEGTVGVEFRSMPERRH